MDICNKIGFIYLATNLTNNKKYVGQTRRTVDERIKDHVKDVKRSKLPFHRAIKKYGIDGFKIDEFEFPEYLLNEKEKEYIIKFETTQTDKGYNIKPGGASEWDYVPPSDESRLKMGWNRGQNLTEEHKKNISESHKKLNFHHSDESKIKMSLKKKENDHLKGKKQSEEHKKKRIESLKKVTNSTVRPVRFTDPDGNIYIEEHSVKQFCEDHNLCRRNVCYVLCGKSNAHKGWKIEYI